MVGAGLWKFPGSFLKTSQDPRRSTAVTQLATTAGTSSRSCTNTSLRVEWQMHQAMASGRGQRASVVRTQQQPPRRSAARKKQKKKKKKPPSSSLGAPEVAPSRAGMPELAAALAELSPMDRPSAAQAREGVFEAITRKPWRNSSRQNGQSISISLFSPIKLHASGVMLLSRPLR